MQMSNRNIVKEYKESKNKAQQIKILADMNLCAPKDIKKILIEAGCAVPGNSIPKKAKVAPVQQKKPNVSEAVVEPEAEK